MTLSFRDEQGKVLRQFDVPYKYFSTMPWRWVEDYVYRDGMLIAAQRPEAVGGQRHFHLDHLGSPRLMTSATGARVAEHDYFPFGVESTPLPQETPAGFEREDPMKFTGHERDLNVGSATDNQNYYDYMHARYYVPQWGRFLSVDPLDGLQRFPQSWNRYAYARANPLKYIDPSGMYIFGACNGSEKQCQADRTAFEQARQENLGSRDAAVRATAAAYGDPGRDNGVTVAFGNVASGVDGTTAPTLQGNADGSMTMATSIMFRSGLTGTKLRGAVGHEGQHLLDAQGFFGSFGSNSKMEGGLSWDTTKNLSVQQTETNAYLVTHAIFTMARQTFQAGCDGCSLGLGARTPADAQLAIGRILANPALPYATKLNNLQFPGWDTPPQPKPNP